MVNNVLPFPNSGGDASGDGPVAPGGGGPHNPNVEARLAVLEQIAKSTEATLKEIRDDIRGMRADQRADTSLLRSELKGEAVSLRSDITALRKDGLSAVRWLLGLSAGGFIAVLGILGRHFHWF